MKRKRKPKRTVDWAAATLDAWVLQQEIDRRLNVLAMKRVELERIRRLLDEAVAQSR